MWDIIEKGLEHNGLVTAFAFVGVIMWISVVLSKRLTFGRIHGSAIAILLGLLLWPSLCSLVQPSLLINRDRPTYADSPPWQLQHCNLHEHLLQHLPLSSPTLFFSLCPSPSLLVLLVSATVAIIGAPLTPALPSPRLPLPIAFIRPSLASSCGRSCGCPYGRRCGRCCG